MTPEDKSKDLWLKNNKKIGLMNDVDNDKGFKKFIMPYLIVALKEQARQKRDEIYDILKQRGSMIDTDLLYLISTKVTKWVI